MNELIIKMLKESDKEIETLVEQSRKDLQDQSENGTLGTNAAALCRSNALITSIVYRMNVKLNMLLEWTLSQNQKP